MSPRGLRHWRSLTVGGMTVQAATWAVAMSALLFSMNCGGGSGSPTAPTTSTTPTTYQNIVGNWSGTQSVVVSSSRTRVFSITCNQAMAITTQSEGTFSGTYAVSGSDTECVYAGTIDAGTLTTSGVVSAKLGTSVNAQDDCTRTQGDGVYQGSLSGSTLILTMTESLACTNPTETLNRTWTITSSKN